MSLRVIRCGEVKGGKPGAEAKASLNRAIESQRIDTKLDELTMGRMKRA